MKKRVQKNNRNKENRFALNTEDAAKYIGVSGALLRKMRGVGEGPFYSRLGKRKIVYPIPELKKYLKDNLVGVR